MTRIREEEDRQTVGRTDRRKRVNRKMGRIVSATDNAQYFIFGRLGSDVNFL